MNLCILDSDLGIRKNFGAKKFQATQIWVEESKDFDDSRSREIQAHSTVDP